MVFAISNIWQSISDFATPRATSIGETFVGIGWPIHFLILAGVLALFGVIFYFSDETRPFLGQLLIAIAILWIGTVFFFITFTFPVPRFGSTSTTAASIPRVWYMALVPTVILVILTTIFGKEEPDPKWGNIKLVGIAIGALAVSISLFGIIGYYISSAIFIVFMMWMLGSRKPLELTLMPIGWVAFSYFIFARVLNVRLPIGSLIENILGR